MRFEPVRVDATKYRPDDGTGDDESMTDLRLTVADRDLTASWTDDAPETRAALADALPVTGEAVRWGDELYFDVPLGDVPLEDPGEVVPEGAIAYWPEGGKLCLFWGPTPASRENEPRAAAPVTVVATIDDVSPLLTIDGGARVRIEPRE